MENFLKHQCLFNIWLFPAKGKRVGIFSAFRAGLNGVSLGGLPWPFTSYWLSSSLWRLCSLSRRSLFPNKYLLHAHNEQRTDVRATGEYAVIIGQTPFLNSCEEGKKKGRGLPECTQWERDTGICVLYGSRGHYFQASVSVRMETQCHFYFCFMEKAEQAPRNLLCARASRGPYISCEHHTLRTTSRLVGLAGYYYMGSGLP